MTKKKYFYRDNHYVSWFRYPKGGYSDSHVDFPADAVFYHDTGLDCYFAFYRQNRREMQGASFSSFELAYERLVKNCRKEGITCPEPENFVLYENASRKLRSSLQWA